MSREPMTFGTTIWSYVSTPMKQMQLYEELEFCQRRYSVKETKQSPLTTKLGVFPAWSSLDYRANLHPHGGRSSNEALG